MKFPWLRQERSWPRRVPGWSGPASIEDSVVITTPYEDSRRFADLRTTFVELDNAAQVYFAGPQGDKFWMVYYAMGWHTRAVAQNFGQLVLQHPGLVVSVAVKGERDVAGLGIGLPTAGQDKVVLERPVIVHPPWTFGFEIQSATTVGEKIRCRIIYVELNQGEVIQAL